MIIKVVVTITVLASALIGFGLGVEYQRNRNEVRYTLRLVQDSTGIYKIDWPAIMPTNAILNIITNKETK